MIIFFFGEDDFQSIQKLAEIKNRFLEKNKEGGTGLANARARLDLMHPGKTGLVIKSANLVYSVNLTISL